MDTHKDLEDRQGDELDQFNNSTDTTNDTSTVTEEKTEVTTPVSIIEPTPSTVPPVAQSQPVAPPTLPETKPQNNPITLVLQWLTYAFWGWFALSIVWLAGVVLAFLVVGANSTDWTTSIAYPIAAVVVLFIVAGAVDFFYTRVEPARKEGVATAIMVIHAVIFALCGIGAVISAVFSIINLLLSGGTDTIASKAILVVLYTSIVMIFVYGLLIARTVLVSKIRRISWISSGVLAALAILFIVLGIVGPVAQSLITRQDRELETALPNVPTLVTDYVQENNKLPNSLSDLSFSNSSYSTDDQTKATVEKGLIKYTANTKDPETSGYNTAMYAEETSVKETLYPDTSSGLTTYFYKLCVTWQAEKNDGTPNRIYPAMDDSTSGASISSSLTYVDVYTHKKGEQCYDLQASVYK